MEKLLIVGIDPGTTKAYAILDLNGKLIKVKSSKKYTLSKLTKELLKYGKPIIVGTDMTKVPKFIDKLAKNFNAKINCPITTLRIGYKRTIVKRFFRYKKFKFGNKHERDALAAAIIAYKKVRKLIDRIDNFLAKINKEELSNEIKKIVLTENLAVRKAIGKIGS